MQTLHFVPESTGEVCEREFGLGAGQPDCLDENTKPRFWGAKTYSTHSRIEDLLKLVARVRFDMGLLVGLRR